MENSMIKERFDIIKEVVKGKNVLDIGCVDHKASTETQEEWLHKRIKKFAKSVEGIDIEEKEVVTLQKKGYTIHLGNMESIDLGKKYDVIVAGNTIEHLFNAGAFLENVKNHLHKNGLFILTTDNCFGFRHLFYALVLGRVPVNRTHTCYYDIETLTYLLNKKGFRIKKKAFYTDAKGWRYFVERIVGMRRVLAPYMIIVAERKDFPEKNTP